MMGSGFYNGNSCNCPRLSSQTRVHIQHLLEYEIKQLNDAIANPKTNLDPSMVKTQYQLLEMITSMLREINNL